MTEPEQMLEVVDRLIAPITARLTEVCQKLDTVVQQTATIGSIEKNVDAHATRLTGLEGDSKKQALELAKISGRNQVLMWGIGILGSVFGIVAAAGFAHLLGWR